MRFTKMQGLGNDYIYLDCTKDYPDDPAALARVMSERHYGVGGDGLILVGRGRTGDFSMEIFNADGSRGELCGNGLRCVGKFLYDRRLTEKTALTIDTGAGPRRVWLELEDGEVRAVRADMGEPFLFPEITLEVHAARWTGTPVSVGNPHFVLLCDDLEAIPLGEIGPVLSAHPVFPGGTNVEFVRVEEGRLHVRVWERGSGETLACGTGACACFAVARAKGLCGEDCRVCLPGGTLELRCVGEGGHILMTGPAQTVFEGEWP